MIPQEKIENLPWSPLHQTSSQYKTLLPPDWPTINNPAVTIPALILAHLAFPALVSEGGPQELAHYTKSCCHQTSQVQGVVITSPPLSAA